jgi:signal transduction histidine kinase
MGAGAALRSLRDKTPDLDRVKGTLEQIESSSLRASKIVDSVRGMFKKDTRITGPVNVNAIISVVLDLARSELYEHDIEVRTKLSSPLPSVAGDAVQLQQVILNLVMNAIEAMHSATPRVLTVTSELSGPDAVHVSVGDTGTGIDPSSLHRIFQPMFTTKATGMGMGLVICRSIIESHHGRIWVAAGVERGSIFEFTIPIGNKNNTKQEENVGRV